MKKFLFYICIFIFYQAGAQAPDPNFNDKAAFSESRNFLKKARFAEADDAGLFDLYYQQLRFNVDPAVNYISGSVLSSVKFMKDNVAEIRFDLNDVLQVDSVYVNKKKVGFEHASDQIKIVLPTVASKNATAEVEVFYQGAPPQNGLGSFVASKHNNSPIIWTLSEPYGARDWWPCKESLTDKIDSIDVYITCPEQYRAASNGKLISDEVSGANRTAHWSHRYPIATYLVALAVTNYQTYSDYLNLLDGKKIEVLNYIYPEYLATAKTKSDQILEILSLYNKKFGIYPFADEKYGHAQFGWGGGMEHQTMSFMYYLEFELVAHEMAHQWFGDCVTLNSWHDIWLNEGFATYLTGLSYENLLNGQYWQTWKDNQVKRIVALPGGSVYVADTTDVDRIFSGRLSYSKGAYLLHMLRWELGDSAFFAGVNNYLNDPTVKYGFGTQEKIVLHMEAAGDTALTGFFNDWYYGEGYPIYRLLYDTDYSDLGKVKLKISQSSSSTTVPFFKMHVPVRVWKNGKYTDLRLYNTEQDQEFVISDSAVDKVEFDPEKWLIAKADVVNPVDENLKSQLVRITNENEFHRIQIFYPEFSGNEQYRVTDLNGRTILTGKLAADITTIDSSGMPSGIYMVEVSNKLLIKTEKVLVK